MTLGQQRFNGRSPQQRLVDQSSRGGLRTLWNGITQYAVALASELRSNSESGDLAHIKVAGTPNPTDHNSTLIQDPISAPNPPQWMHENTKEPHGLNILCLDGGGVRGLSSLILLSEIMNRLGALDGCKKPPNPYEYFDVIAGTGTGGVNACLLGRLRVSLPETILSYGELVENVFLDKKSTGRSAYKSTRLRKTLKSIIQQVTGNEDERMMDDRAGHRCKTMVFAMAKDNLNGSVPTMFRSYDAVTNPGPDCSIWEALCATMAHPDLFKEIEIGEYPLKQAFVGGELGANNPIAHVLEEVKKLYPGRHVASIISIGAGHVRTIRIPDYSFPYIFRTGETVVVKNMAVDSERVAEEMAKRFQDTKGVYFRFNVDQGTQEIETDDWEKLGQVTAHTRAYMFKAKTSAYMDWATKSIKRKAPAIAVAHIDGRIPGQVDTTRAYNLALKQCPSPTPIFTGCDTKIQGVERCMFGPNNSVPIDRSRLCKSLLEDGCSSRKRRIGVIYGLGGSGKTQVALKVIERNRDKWSRVLYVSASSREAIEGTLQMFARSKGIGHDYQDTLDWLEHSQEPWLLLFDGADHASLDIRKYFPGGQCGNILITTRLPRLAVYAHGPSSCCFVSGMDPQDALALLLRTACLRGRAPSEDELGAAMALVQDLGYLALAVVHAGAYIGYSPHISIARYRKLFLTQKRRMLEGHSKLRVKFDDYQKTVYTTWKICYDSLRHHESRQTFWLIAYLHHEDVTEAILERAAVNARLCVPILPPTELQLKARGYMHTYLGQFLDPNGHWDPLKFSRVIGELASYSLLEFDRANMSYNIHVLVQDWARTLIPLPDNLALQCTTSLLSYSIGEPNDETSIAYSIRIRPHVNAILGALGGEIGANNGVYFAEVFKASGQWAREEIIRALVYVACNDRLGIRHPEAMRSLRNLLLTLFNQKKWREAETLTKYALTALEPLDEAHSGLLNNTERLVEYYISRSQTDSIWEILAGVQEAVTSGLGGPKALRLRAKVGELEPAKTRYLQQGARRLPGSLVKALWSRRIASSSPRAQPSKTALTTLLISFLVLILFRI